MTVLSERRNVSMHARTRFKLRAVPTEASTEPRATEAAETAADAEDAGEDEEDDTDDASTGSMPYLLFVVLVGFRLCNAVATALPALFGESSDDAARRAALGKACAVAVVLYSCCSSSVFQSRRRGDAVDATADDFASEDAAPVDAAPACDAPPDARTRTQRLRTTTVTLSVVATLAWSASSALQALKPHDLSWCSAAAALFRSARPPVADSRRKRFHDDGRRPYDDGRRRPYDRRHDDSYAGQRRQRHDAGAGPRRGDGAHSLWAADDVWGPTGSACDAQGPCDAATTCGALVLSPADGDRAGDGDGRAGDDRGGDDRGGGDRGGGDRRGLSEALVSAMWTAGGRGLSAHIAERLSRALEVALDVSSSFGCNGARVDLGKRAPEVLRFKRLADRPQHLVNQLGGTANELAVFDVDLEWVLEDAQIAMDLTMTGTLAKYAVPKLGLVFANATLRRTRTTFAFELEAAYPFVRRVAASFATTPVLESRSYVGADSGSADFEFQPFAALLRDELVAALPVEPRALSFDLGLWLTTCNAIAEEARGDDDHRGRPTLRRRVTAARRRRRRSDRSAVGSCGSKGGRRRRLRGGGRRRWHARATGCGRASTPSTALGGGSSAPPPTRRPTRPRRTPTRQTRRTRPRRTR
ncbi:hypothetical protein M885DRAFT_327091 [Pelagophyceae sp. CCMP2097]|nr:hypothetical protein M885DRAFT_327091 [Pelagophyceae sp. CCMP2097]